MQRPAATAGLRHIALFVREFAACEQFYVELLGMRVEWRPDSGNVYLTSGNDNLALHRSEDEFTGPQHLDHIGFILDTPGQWTNGMNFYAPIRWRCAPGPRPTGMVRTVFIVMILMATWCR